MSATDVICTALEGAGIKRRVEEVADAVEGALCEAGLLAEDATEVEVRGARVAVETIEAYGLTITLDANGNAVTVTSPYGLEVNA